MLTHNRCRKYVFNVKDYIEKKLEGYTKVEDLTK